MIVAIVLFSIGFIAFVIEAWYKLKKPTHLTDRDKKQDDTNR
jgi:hypothetical protein